MFRIRVGNEKLWRLTRDIPLLKRLIRADLQAITAMRSPESIDLAFSKIDLLGGISKQTNSDRFSDVDAVTIEIIKSRSLRCIHDVGVSSGITSLELLRGLRRHSFDGKFFISDKFAQFWINRRWVSTDIYDSDQRLVCTYLGPIAGDSDDTWTLPLSRLVFKLALRRSFDRERKESLLLLHPEVLRAVEKNEIEFLDFDVLTAGSAYEFDFIRCMNLLNLGYFDSSDIMRGLDVLHQGLSEGGVLQLGRTHEDGSNHVTFYEKSDGRFAHFESIGDGSEIDEMVRGYSYSA